MFGPLGDLVGLFTNLGENMTQWYNDLLVVTVQYMLSVSAPSVKEISSGFFSVRLGGTLGLANLIITAVVVLIAFVMLLTIKRDHSRIVGRTVTSMIGLVLFALLFYRVYALLFNLQQIMVEFTLRFMTGTSNPEALEVNSTIQNLDPLAVLAVSFFGWFFGWLTLAEAYGLHVLFISVLIFYPLTIALRPLGGFFNTAFHAANAALLVVLVAPPVMAACLFLPIWVGNVLPGGQMVAGITTFIGGLMALLAPIVFFIMTMRFSNSVFGSIDAKIAGAVDVKSMPAFSMKDINDNVRDTHMAPTTPSQPAPVASVPSGSLMADVKGIAVGAAAAGIATAGHPHVAAGVKAADKAATRSIETYKKKGQGTK